MVRLFLFFLAVFTLWLAEFTVAEQKITASLEKIGVETDTDGLAKLEEAKTLSSVDATLLDENQGVETVGFNTGDLFRACVDNQTDYPCLFYLYNGGTYKNYFLVRPNTKKCIERPSESSQYFKIVSKDEVLTEDQMGCQC